MILSALVGASAGAALASFAVVCAERLERDESPWLGRSRCAGCGMRLSALQLVPVLSYLATRGACASCAAPIPRRLLAVEVFGGLVGAGLGAGAERWPWTAGVAILLTALLACALTDLESGYIYDAVVVAAMIAISVAALVGARAFDAAAGATVSGGLLASIAALTRGRGMGAGDVKLALAIGAAMGPADGVRALCAAFVYGALVSLALVATRRARWGSRVAFAPFLALGALTAALARAAGVA